MGAIAATIVFSTAEETHRLLLVTSASPGQGKMTVAAGQWGQGGFGQWGSERFKPICALQKAREVGLTPESLHPLGRFALAELETQLEVAQQ